MSGAVVRRERRVYSYGTGCTRCRRGLKASGPRRGGLDALVLLGGGVEPGGWGTHGSDKEAGGIGRQRDLDPAAVNLNLFN